MRSTKKIVPHEFWHYTKYWQLLQHQPIPAKTAQYWPRQSVQRPTSREGQGAKALFVGPALFGWLFLADLNTVVVE